MSNDGRLEAAWRASFGSLAASDAAPDVCCRLDLVDTVPVAPQGEVGYRQGDLLSYSVEGERAIAHLPRFGQLRFDLAAGVTKGVVIEDALTTYGVLEDLVAIGLSPHLRRRGLFLIHAFAASWQGRAALLVGGIGAGKTTTGLALLDAGWKLLSNDSPVVRVGEKVEILSYPGLLAAYPDSFGRFEATRDLARKVGGRDFSRLRPTAVAECVAASAVSGQRPEAPTSPNERRKITVAAEAVWPGVWGERAQAGAIFFPQIEAREGHALEPLNQPEALRRLLPHAIEQWDRTMIPAHLAALRRLVEAAPAYLLRLGPEVGAIPGLVVSAL